MTRWLHRAADSPFVAGRIRERGGNAGIGAAGDDPAPAEPTPDGFLWGVAASSPRTESVDGRGGSVWDVFAKRPGGLREGSDLRVTTAFERLYATDIGLIAGCWRLRALRLSFASQRLHSGAKLAQCRRQGVAATSGAGFLARHPLAVAMTGSLGASVDALRQMPETADMQEKDRLFAGSMPAIYDRYLGPLIFAPYARDLADRVAAHPAASVLETAAGTGVATRALVRALPAGIRIIATDLNPPMLDFAAARSAAANVVWQQADAMMLPFDDGTFGAVACQFGAMFFVDKVTAYREAHRMLRPGGRFFFSIWDRIEHNDLASVVTEAVASLFPEDPPRFLARTPHGYFDTGRIGDELRTAGFAGVAIETVERSSQAHAPRHPAIGFCQGTPLRGEIEARDPGRLGEATDTAARAIAARFGNGPFECRMQAHVIVAAR